MFFHVGLFVLQFLFLVAKGQESSALAALYAPSLSPGTEIIEGEANKRWSVWSKPTFALTIRPRTDEDVQNIVSTFKYCAKVVAYHVEGQNIECKQHHFLGDRR
jgi:hypothetical protein